MDVLFKIVKLIRIFYNILYWLDSYCFVCIAAQAIPQGSPLSDLTFGVTWLIGRPCANMVVLCLLKAVLTPCLLWFVALHWWQRWKTSNLTATWDQWSYVDGLCDRISTSCVVPCGNFDCVFQTFQPSRFDRESPDLMCCLPLSRFLSGSPDLS